MEQHNGRAMDICILKTEEVSKKNFHVITTAFQDKFPALKATWQTTYS